jgi:hypothetical protein
MFLNRTADENYTEEGIYVSFSSSDLSNPNNWSNPPVEVYHGGNWYPEVVGVDDIRGFRRGTDKLAGQVARYYNSNGLGGSDSNYEVTFANPQEPAFIASASADPSHCDGGSCTLWVSGLGIADDAAVYLRSNDISLSYLSSQNGAQLSRSDQGSGQLLALTISDPALLDRFSTKGLRISVANPQDNTESPTVVVRSPVLSDTSGVPPVIDTAGFGGPDNYCVWIAGSHFADNSYIDIRKTDGSGEIIASAIGSDTFQYPPDLAPNSQVMTFCLTDEPLKKRFASEGLNVSVVNPTQGNWSNGATVHRF